MRTRPLAATALAAAGSILAHGCGGSSPPPAPALLSGEAAIAAAAANPVTVSPLPGTRDASPETQISFLGGPETTVSEVRVSGSRSGAHAGALRSYSTATGASFVPAHRFVAGERVSVRASVGRGSATRTASTTFTVADRAAVSQAPFPNEGGDPSAVQHFLSAPGLNPSTVTIATPPQPGASPGYLFLAPYQGRGTPGPEIVDQRGGLVWFHPLPAGEKAMNFDVQHYRGKPVLSWWQGRVLGLGFGQGEDLLYDRAYRQIATIRAGNGYQADLHVLRLTPQGTAFIDAFAPVHVDLSAVHGSANGLLSDSIIQEIDVATGLVMWEWHALGHVHAGESHIHPPPDGYPWDFVHLNSLDLGAGEDVLLGGRNTWALYDVDIHSGAVRWRLGGTHSSFKLEPGTRFYWQHDGEFQPGGLISLFDNGSDPPEETQSRALLVRPDPLTHSARVVAQFANPNRTLLAASQGNALKLSHGNWLVGYGRLPNFTEFSASGSVLLDASLGRDVQDFTTFLARWRGQPSYPPSLALRPLGGGAVQLAASWNGATQVTSWRVLEGASAKRLKAVLNVPKEGFETTFSLQLPGSFVAVEALDRAGHELGRSATVRG
jgi:arylsulfotransferase ASST